MRKITIVFSVIIVILLIFTGCPKSNQEQESDSLLQSAPNSQEESTSGESEKMDWANIGHLSPHDEVKFVIAGRTDYEWARDIVHKHDLSSRCNAVLFSPVFGEIEPREMVEWILKERLDVRFHLQLHKHIWPPDQRGV